MSKFKNNEEFFEFSKELVSIPISEICKLLETHKIKLPLFAYRFLLKETIRDEVFEEKRFESYTDELKYRLRNYDNYSIYLLEKLIDKYDLDFDLAKFKILLCDFLFLNKDELKIGKSFFTELEKLKKDFPEEKQRLSYQQFYETIKSVLSQTVGYIDGIHTDDWTDDALTSHTLGDLKSLGQKYNIKVPRRINKSRLIDILVAKFRLTDEEKEALEDKSILDIEIYAKDKGFRISTDLKKKDMIEFLRYSLGIYHKDVPDDNFNYELPLAGKTEIFEEEEKEVPEEKETIEVKEEKVVVEEVEEDTSPDIEAIEEELEEAIEDVTEEFEEEIFEEEISEEVQTEEETSDIEIEELEEEPEKPKTKKSDEIKDSVPTELADSELLTEEEKELLDEKIAFIIRKYHQKKRRKKILWTIFIVLLVLLVGFIAYSYIYYHYINDGNLPFNIPLFWK
ncbi:MAG: hypothetical protein K9L64_00215 [Candidatus Izimaplasma sp.]|nr:hypothetical protein [Candidatus Izimaplasma bacterium]